MRPVVKKKVIKRVKKKLKYEINPDFVQEYVETNELSLEEIDVYIKFLVSEYKKEKEERHRFQIERDKLIEMREIEKKKFEDLKAYIIDTHEQLASLEEDHYQEIAMFKKKVRYLMSEHESKINNLKLEIEKLNKENIDESLKEKQNQIFQVNKLTKLLNEKECQYEDMIKNLTLEYENRISKMRQENAEHAKAIQKTMEMRFNEERAQFNLMTRNATHEITEIKNIQINELINLNNKAFDDLRNYFKDLMSNSMILATSLESKNKKAIINEKESVSKAKNYEIELEKTAEENKMLKISQASLKRKSELYDVEKRLFEQQTKDYKNLTEKFSKLDLKYEMLLKSYNDLEKDYDALTRNTEASNLIFQEKCNNKILITNRKVEVLLKDLSRYEDFLKAFSFDDNSNTIEMLRDADDRSLKNLSKNSRFDFHQILFQFRIRESVIDEQNRNLVEICYRYNELIEIIREVNYEARVLLDNLGIEVIKVEKICRDFNKPKETC